jgi:N-methylhydantoinase A
MGSFRIGIDIGGTFTDLVAIGPDGTVSVGKLSSTPDDYSRAISEGLGELLARADLGADEIGELVHGTTVATNAVLERKGALTGLLTTEGFRDVLELRRIRAPVVFNMGWEKPKPLVDRRLRLEVAERVDHDGGVVRPLDAASVRAALARFREEGVASIAVCLINAYANPAHERAIAGIAREELPEVPVSLSSDVSPEIREYERTSTTVINAYVRPLMARYLGSLKRRLADLRVGAPLLVMQSNGGIMSASKAAELPVQLLESGPAAGVIAAAQLSRRLGLRRAISFDMGGTTAKASLVVDGRITYSPELEVGAPISLASRLVTGGGYPVRTATADIAEVGAGAGSIAELNAAGAIRVGPRSAGASPGPACYGLGGTEPTVTDANVVLGYIDPANFVGGHMRLDPELARQAIVTKLADRVGRSLEEVAFGIHLIANATMVRAVKAVTIERGRDVREFTLIAFGGSGPVHAAQLARAIGVRRVVVPPIAGLFSAVGLLLAEVEHHSVRTFMQPIAQMDPARVAETVGALRDELLKTLADEGYPESRVRLEGFADLRYRGQSFELSVPFTLDAKGRLDLNAIAERFGEEHERAYGHRTPDGEVELVNLRFAGRGLAERPAAITAAGEVSAAAMGLSSRDAYFGPSHGWQRAKILRRSDLNSRPLAGPAIVEEYDTSVVVPPGATVWRDEQQNILIEVTA